MSKNREKEKPATWEPIKMCGVIFTRTHIYTNTFSMLASTFSPLNFHVLFSCSLLLTILSLEGFVKSLERFVKDKIVNYHQACKSTRMRLLLLN